eukprot:g7070.t1
MSSNSLPEDSMTSQCAPDGMECQDSQYCCSGHCPGGKLGVCWGTCSPRHPRRRHHRGCVIRVSHPLWTKAPTLDREILVEEIMTAVVVCIAITLIIEEHHTSMYAIIVILKAPKPL